jgi:ribA/ribD-fused uncharacterized protein
MDCETVVVSLAGEDGKLERCELYLHDTSWVNKEYVRIEFKKYSVITAHESRTYFQALLRLRHQLEKQSLQILCNGAAETVYPSDMQLSMGTGRMANRLLIGKQTQKDDVVDVFGYDSTLEFVTIEKQKVFYKKWIKSVLGEKGRYDIEFYRVQDEYGFLSNFYPSIFTLDGKVWPTSEHYFQAMKFVGTEYETKIRTAKSPMEAANMGRDRRFPLRKDWNAVRVSVMTNSVLAKFSQNDGLKEQLIKTDNRYLIEKTAEDYFWGCGIDGSGENMLGKILMKVRDDLLNGEMPK